MVVGHPVEILTRLLWNINEKSYHRLLQRQRSRLVFRRCLVRISAIRTKDRIGFTQPLWTNSGIMTSIRPWSLPYKSFPIHQTSYVPSDSIIQILKELLNNPQNQLAGIWKSSHIIQCYTSTLIIERGKPGMQLARGELKAKSISSLHGGPPCADVLRKTQQFSSQLRSRTTGSLITSYLEVYERDLDFNV